MVVAQNLSAYMQKARIYAKGTCIIFHKFIVKTFTTFMGEDMLIGFRSNQMISFDQAHVGVIRYTCLLRSIAQDDRNYQFQMLSNRLFLFLQSIKMLIQPIYYQMEGLTTYSKFRNVWDSWDFYWKMVNYGCVNLKRSRFGRVWLRMLFMCLIEKTASSGFRRFAAFGNIFYDKTLKQFWMDYVLNCCTYDWSLFLVVNGWRARPWPRHNQRILWK